MRSALRPFSSVRRGEACRDELMFLAELHKDLPSRNRNAASAKIMHDLVDNIVVTRVNHSGHHDLKGVGSAAFLRQAKLGSGPEADAHVAACVQAIRRIARELHGEISRSFRD